jgi:hypothetical protein
VSADTIRGIDDPHRDFRSMSICPACSLRLHHRCGSPWIASREIGSFEILESGRDMRRNDIASVDGSTALRAERLLMLSLPNVIPFLGRRNTSSVHSEWMRSAG